jgi:hypothetical protein
MLLIDPEFFPDIRFTDSIPMELHRLPVIFPIHKNMCMTFPKHISSFMLKKSRLRLFRARAVLRSN